MATGADDEGAVYGALEVREVRSGLGAKPGAAGVETIEAEDQGVVGEAMAAGQRQLARRVGQLDVKAGEGRARRQRAGTGGIDVGAAE